MSYITMLNRMRLPKGEPSIAKLESEMKFSPQTKDTRRTTSFIAPGLKCSDCGHDTCEATASTISRDVLYIRCMRCNSTW